MNTPTTPKEIKSSTITAMVHEMERFPYLHITQSELVPAGLYHAVRLPPQLAYRIVDWVIEAPAAFEHAHDAAERLNHTCIRLYRDTSGFVVIFVEDLGGQLAWILSPVTTGHPANAPGWLARNMEAIHGGLDLLDKITRLRNELALATPHTVVINGQEYFKAPPTGDH